MHAAVESSSDKIAYKCNACSSSDIALYVSIPPYKMIKCRRCGLLALEPQPSEKELLDWYAQDAFKEGARVLIVDDLLATGGTTRAVIDLAEKMGGKIAGVVFLIELTALKGREKLKGYPVYSLIKDKYC